MIKDDRVAHEDKRGAFARNQDVSHKIDIRASGGQPLHDPDDDFEGLV